MAVFTWREGWLLIAGVEELYRRGSITVDEYDALIETIQAQTEAEESFIDKALEGR